MKSLSLTFLVFPLFLAIAFSGCISNPTPTPTASPTASPTVAPVNQLYAEVLVKDPACSFDGYCFDEYLIFPSGQILKKFLSASKPGLLQAKIRQASPEAAMELISWAQSSWQPQDAGCSNCAEYHAILHDKTSTRSISAGSGSALAFVKEFFSKSAAVYEEAHEVEPFYVQLYYKRRNENLQDYHFLPDGTVVHEVFGEEEKLLFAKVLKVGNSSVRLAMAGFENSPSDYRSCISNNYEYSVIDFVSGSGLESSFSCGIGDAPADRSYRSLLALVE